jgi:hypothetical protein
MQLLVQRQHLLCAFKTCVHCKQPTTQTFDGTVSCPCSNGTDSKEGVAGSVQYLIVSKHAIAANEWREDGSCVRRLTTNETNRGALTRDKLRAPQALCLDPHVAITKLFYSSLQTSSFAYVGAGGQVKKVHRAQTIVAFEILGITFDPNAHLDDGGVLQKGMQLGR